MVNNDELMVNGWKSDIFWVYNLYIYGVELIVVESYTTYVIILVITNPHPIDYIYMYNGSSHQGCKKSGSLIYIYI